MYLYTEREHREATRLVSMRRGIAPIEYSNKSRTDRCIQSWVRVSELPSECAAARMQQQQRPHTQKMERKTM